MVLDWIDSRRRDTAAAAAAADQCSFVDRSSKGVAAVVAVADVVAVVVVVEIKWHLGIDEHICMNHQRHQGCGLKRPPL